MLVFSEANNYPFPNMTFEIEDQTVIHEDTTTEENPPAFNFLVPVVMDRGPANQFKLFRPGDLNLFISMYGKPNPNKYGFGPDFIAGILSEANANTDLGVYVINLRGLDATAATAIVLMKYKIEEGVQKTDDDGNPLYMDAVTGEETTVSTDNEPITRDVLHTKFTSTYSDNTSKWTQMLTGLSAFYSTEPDEDGYLTYPLFAVVNRSNSSFSNNCYMRILPSISQYDNKCYYAFEVFNGDATITTEADALFTPDAALEYAEQKFNSYVSGMTYVSSPYMDDIVDLLNKYVTGNDINYVDFMSSEGNGYTYVVDTDSEDFTATKAISFNGGHDGTGSREELMVKFFNNEIITDVKSTIRYHFHYIPDCGYAHTPDNPETDVIGAIKEFVKSRIFTTTSTIMVGGEHTFMSAVNEHIQYHNDDMPNIRQLCRHQCPMMYNPWISRMITYPVTYFDTMTLVRTLNINGNLYSPMAGAKYRLTGYIEDTMNYAPENKDLINDLESARVNVVMKDMQTGGYLSNQLMCTKLISDRTEMNNAFLISDMIYALIQLIHRNTFTFNEESEVTAFKQEVDDKINAVYSRYAARMNCDVYRKGSTGRASQTKVIKIGIDLKDISKYANTYITLMNE